MELDENLDAVKVKLDDFDQLVTKFCAVHKSYTDSLMSTAEQCDSEEYVLTLREDIDSFHWAVRTWMKQAAERKMAVLQRVVTNVTQEIEMNLSGQHGPAPRRDATAAAAAPRSEFYHSTPAITSRWFATSRLRVPVSVTLVYYDALMTHHTTENGLMAGINFFCCRSDKKEPPDRSKLSKSATYCKHEPEKFIIYL